MNANTMTVEHLGDGATDADLRQFRAFVIDLTFRHDLTEQEATDMLWGDGDWTANAVQLGLVPPDAPTCDEPTDARTAENRWL